MDDVRFDAIARKLGARFSRRSFLGGAAGVAALAALPLRNAAAKVTAADAKSTVEQFYQLVDAYDYASAYALLGSAWQQSQSQSTFTNGYADTAFVELRVSGTAEAKDGKQVNVKLTSWHNDGSVKGYAGHYVVGTEGGQTKLISASIKAAAAPSVPPLCKLADLSFALQGGDAGAGSRFGSIVGTNTSGDTCVVGGSPALTIRDSSTGNRLDSTSEPGTPATAVTLAPNASAVAEYRFANWCGANPPKNFSVTVHVPGDFGNATITDELDTISFPPCLGSGEAALLGIKGWTAA